ncbi:MAG: hypothetical protein L3K08_09125, partial [Thermoplasmata archaeon]|nr:hypothetical protein [Thermoplasmata archaeon]
MALLTVAFIGLLLSTPPLNPHAGVIGVPSGSPNPPTGDSPRSAPLAFGTLGTGPAGAPGSAKAAPLVAGNSTFQGKVYGIAYDGGPVSPLAGATVEILAVNRTTVLMTTTADSGGNYSVSVSRIGTFYVASQPIGSWGGGWPSGRSALSPTVFAAFGTVTVDLYAYPRITYNNETIVLPGWDNYSAYLDNSNGNAASTYVQQPVLSWVQDGVYYIN